MSHLVVGGAGFLGSHLVERLLLDGQAVVVVDDLSSGRLANLAAARESGGSLQIHQLRVGDEGTAELMAKVRPEVVTHLGSPGAHATGAASIDGLACLLTLLEAAADAEVSRMVVALDAGALYAPSPDRRRLTESEAVEPTVSGIGERAVLDALAAYRRDRSVEFVALALTAVYGPRMHADAGTGLIDQVVTGAGGGDSCVLEPDEVARDVVFVDDVVDALVRAGERGSGLLVNIGSGQAVTAEQVAWAATGLGVTVTSTVAGRESGHRLVLDVNRARIHLGWQPFTELGEGLRATLEWRAGSAPRP
jgi:UDP-glucose 4-epimerase